MAPKKQKKPIPQQQQKRKSNRTTWIAIGAIALVVIIFGVVAGSGMLGNKSGGTANPTATPQPIASTQVLLQTTAGNITIDLRTDKPITSSNFINLVKEGKYDGTPFYRTIPGFMIQGGKVSGNVAAIPDEIGTNNHNVNYTVAMAKTSQPNSATSEFFINAADNSKITYPDGTTFDGTYTVFGTVISGQNVVDAIANAPATANPSNPSEVSNPVNPVTIIHATIVS